MIAARDPTLKAIGERVRQRRRERSMTQEQLAESAELSKSFVSEVEGGLTSGSGLTYLRLADALDVEVQWLLKGGSVPAMAAPPPLPTVPALVSEVADRKGWSHRFTLDVAAAVASVLVRRTQGGEPWQLTREYIERIGEAMREEPDDGR